MYMTLPDANVFSIIIVSALACHGVFNRFEPRRPLVHLILLVLIPGLLSLLLLGRYTILWATFTTFATYLITLSLSVVIYRLSPFHPLAQYPGPVLAKITKLWSLQKATGKKQYLVYQKLHERYGDVVRVGPNELSFCNVEAVNPILGPSGMPKGRFWDGRAAGAAVRSLIGQREPKEHARRRRPWNRAFSTAALKEYENTLSVRVLQLTERLAEQVGVIDLSMWISYFTYDFMGDMAFGGGFELLRDGDIHGLWQSQLASLKETNILAHMEWIAPYFAKLPLGKSFKMFRAFAIQRATIRKQEGSLKKDIFHHLIDESGIQATPPPMSEVVSDGALVIVAGSDTTSTMVTNLFWLLLRNPSTYLILQQEVDKHFRNEDHALDTAKHANMPYLNAVINEALRLFPAVPTGSNRGPSKGSGGHVVAEHFLHESTSAFVHFYSLHRDPRYFSLPNDFIPDRWLSPSERASINSTLHLHPPNSFIHNPSAFIPFSFGPSNCVGKNLAMVEMRMTVCQIMHCFDMRFEEGWDSGEYEESLCDHFVLSKGRLPVLLSARTLSPEKNELF